MELDLTNINKSVKGANTEMKLASVLAEMQDYIDKLVKINELRNQYNLGDWKDTFVPTQQKTTGQKRTSLPPTLSVLPKHPVSPKSKTISATQSIPTIGRDLITSVF